MTRIRLHPKRGLDPRLLVCPRCGEGVGVTVGAQPDSVPEHARIADSQPCSACCDKQRACDEQVRAGGVYFKCDACGSEGAIRAGSELAVRVRVTHGAAPSAAGVYAPVGVVEAAARDAYDRGWGDGWRGMVLHDGREHGIKAAVAHALRAAQEPPRA